MKRIVIVGNADVRADTAAMVEEADLIVRFNSCRNIPKTGKKTDILAISIDGFPPEGMHPREVWCMHGRILAENHWLRSVPGVVIERLGLSDVQSRAGPSCAGLWPIELITHGATPSSGLWALRVLMARYADVSERQIMLIGFTWKGWFGHDWAAEQHYCEQLEASGLIEIVR